MLRSRASWISRLIGADSGEMLAVTRFRATKDPKPV